MRIALLLTALVLAGCAGAPQPGSTRAICYDAAREAEQQCLNDAFEYERDNNVKVLYPDPRLVCMRLGNARRARCS